MDLKKLPVLWRSNRTAWMNSRIFTDWLNEFDSAMKKQKRHVLLFLDNAPVHPPDIQLDNIKLKFFPSNTTSRIQPLDQGIIRAFKAHYRKNLVKHIIASAGSATTADDIGITALDAVYWIEAAWQEVSETTIRNTFRSSGFEHRSIVEHTSLSMSSSMPEVSMENNCMDELDKVLKHVTIGGQSISAFEYVVRYQENQLF